jgi:hypothetical protein
VPHPNPSPKERGSNNVIINFASKVLSFGEDLGEAIAPG